MSGEVYYTLDDPARHMIEQLKVGGRLIGPVQEGDRQHLVLLEKGARDIKTNVICEVLYVSLRGVYGG